MKNLLLLSYLIGLLTFLTGCDSTQDEFPPKREKTWVFLELEKVMKNDTSDFYLYGEINQSILDNIANGVIDPAMFEFSTIRYIDEEDLLQLYEDETDRGIYFFRTEDIQTTRVLKADPVLTFPENELGERANEFKKRILLTNRE